MKTYITLLFILCFSISSVAQSTCSSYYPFDEDTIFQITSYDKKGKTEAVIDYSITNVS